MQFLLYNEVNQLYVRVPSHSSWSPQSPELSSLCSTVVSTSYLLYTRWSLYISHVNPNLPVHSALPSPTWVHVHSLHLCFSFCPANRLISTTLQIGSSVPFSRFYIYVLIYWLNGHEFGQIPRESEGQGSLACYSLWGCKESDMT